MTTNQTHIYVVDRLLGLLAGPFPRDASKVHSEQPVVLGRGWMPYPDASVILAPSDAYLDHLPTPREIRLLVEVSDTTYALDRGKKLKRYARAGIPESWIVNIPDRFVQVFRDPTGNRYGTSAVFREGESVMGIAVEDLLPSA